MTASTHGSVMLRSRSAQAAQLCRESSASDIPLYIHHFGVPRGDAHWRGCRGQRPRPRAAQATHLKQAESAAHADRALLLSEAYHPVILW